MSLVNIYKVKIENNCVSVWGVKKVESIADKEAVLVVESGKTIVKGGGISVNKLDLDAGSICLQFESLDAICFNQSKKGWLKGLLK